MKRLTYFLFGLLFFYSCEQDAFFNVEGGHTKLYAFSEITPEDKIKVKVNVAPGLNTEDDYFYPKQADAKVVLLKDGKPLDDPGFRYLSREKAFVSQGSFRPEPGVEYGLKISLKDDNSISPIVGTTVIPDPNFISKYLLEKYSTEQFNPKHKNLEVQIRVPLKESEHRYFVVKPFFRNADGEREDLLIKEIRSGKNGCYYSKFNEGLLVDTDKISDDIALTLVNEKFIPVQFELEEIHFELVTITGHAYQYYKSYSKQVASQTVSLSEPVISYSNFENGLGLFTGYSSTINTIELY
ncbi:DUF4249 family protein [Portibacter marinus]|uniref:DUF4249 family protein n=1 Tax=Portibacter marinus TaxID=2898660 RepID=UPI001F1597C7|nr:DUF4249 family protein [Portibacter marinus]